MTKPVTRKMAVDALLYRFRIHGIIDPTEGGNFALLPCAICGDPLLPGQQIQFDHFHADIFGGPHEYQNLRPVHYDPCHKKKTARDIKDNAKIKRLRGETKGRPKRKWAKRKMKSRPFQKRKP